MAQPLSGLDAIACVRADLCIVAGWSEVKTQPVAVTDGVLAVFSHGVFHDVSVYGSVNTFKGVACETAGVCYAVGYVTDFKEGVLTQVHVTSLSLSATPGFVPGTSELAAVTCPTSTRCYAAGGWFALAAVHQAAVVTLVKGRSSSPAATNLAYYGSDDGVACTSATTCTTVGSMETNAQDFMYEAYTEPISSLGAGTAHVLTAAEYLMGIATLDPHHQVAVGARPGGIGLTDLITNGAAAAQPVNAPVDLQAIACPTRTACLAVGAATVDKRDEGVIVRLVFENAG